MRTLTHALSGQTCSIHVLESDADLDAFTAFLAQGDTVLAFDTETTGLDIYSPLHRLRLVQIGNAETAFVLDAARFAGALREAFAAPRHWVAHNAAYDLQVLDRHGIVSIEAVAARVFDTRILAHLLDPRDKGEGGLGLRLKDLSEVYVDAAAPDGEKDLTALFRSHGLTKANGFARIDLTDETFLRYAGLDVLLTSRLFAELAPRVKECGLSHLSTFEHHLQTLLSLMQRRGMRLDVPYIEQLKSDLAAEAETNRKLAARYGVDNVNSIKQVAEALLAMGETLTEKTPSGAWKVDKSVLMGLADFDPDWQPLDSRPPNALAAAVLRAKRAGKWSTSYVDAFLDLRDADDRLHPSIGGLQARTARMSVSRPPLQQLPSNDWRIRRAFIADEGQSIIAADYAQVEMRVLAALSGDETMIEAIRSGVDLHDFTASAVFGPDFTSRQRKLCKAVGFGKVYGGGAATIQRQTGASLEGVKTAIAKYDETFPGIRKYAGKLQRAAEYGKREVVTPSGRHLPLDKDRLYAATNYVVQSTARDLLAQAVVDLFDAGLGDHLLLPVHDELIAQAPAAEAAEVIAEIGRVMESDFFGLRILSDPEVYGLSWGHGYGAPY